jgi:hypothetical protein
LYIKTLYLEKQNINRNFAHRSDPFSCVMSLLLPGCFCAEVVLVAVADCPSSKTYKQKNCDVASCFVACALEMIPTVPKDAVCFFNHCLCCS